MKNFLQLISLLLPWQMRRAFLEQQFGFQIHPTARIGLAWVLPSRLIMEENTSIGHFTVAKNLNLLHLKAHATIGRGNWITGFPLGDSRHFASETERRPELVMGEHSAITHRHLFDCTNAITIGRFTTVAGVSSSNLRVLQTVQTLNPETGGVARSVISLSKGLQQHGVQVEIVALDKPESPWLHDRSLTVHALGPGLTGYHYSRALLKWLEKHCDKFDCVIVHGLW